MSVGRAIAILLLSALVALPARAATLYATGSDPDVLYTINTITGAIGTVGSYSLVNSPADEYGIGGLEFAPDGTLYGVSVGPSARLYTLSTTTATAAAIGLLSVNNIFEGGMAFEPQGGTAYTINVGSSTINSLATINPATGQATAVGLVGGGTHDFAGLAFDPSGQLFGIDRIGNSLWRVDKANPSGPGTVKVGDLGAGIDMGPVGGMTRDPLTGLVYGYASNSKHLFTINLGTGAATVLHTFNAPTDPTFWSIAAPIPEPATIGLVTLGCILLRRRRPTRG
jgi:DNA-binding beta-propeller fold protein YncE